MRFISLPLKGACLIQDEPFADDRGRFARIYCARELAEVGLHKPMVQANMSLTRQVGSIRGMHFQRPPAAEAKIIRCLHGAVYDVIVALRSASDTYLQWHGVELRPEAGQALLVPEGFAHGFQVLEPDSQLLYLHSEFYTPESEAGVRFDDPALGIEWPLAVADVSERDRNHVLIDSKFKGIDI